MLFKNHNHLHFKVSYISISGEGNGTPLQYSCLENPMDGGAWWAAVHGVAQSRTQLSDFTSTFHFHALEKEMATHSNVLAWRIPGMGKPGGLLSMGSHRVRRDWSDLAHNTHMLFHLLVFHKYFSVIKHTLKTLKCWQYPTLSACVLSPFSRVRLFASSWTAAC